MELLLKKSKIFDWKISEKNLKKVLTFGSVDSKILIAFGSLTLPFKPHNTQILYLSLLLAYFFVKFEKIIRASLR